MSGFYPVTSNRASTQLTLSRMLYQIHSSQDGIFDLQNQLSTGRRVNRPSDDPTSAIRAIGAQRQLEYKQQTDVNLRSADSMLVASEASLSQAQDLLTQMRGVVVEAAGNTKSPEEYEALRAQVDAAISSLTDIANSKFQDQFLFSGGGGDDVPFELLGDAVRFHGNEAQFNTIGDYATVLATNVNPEESFGVRSDEVISTADLNPTISGDTPLSMLNAGDGVRDGVIALSDGINRTEVDLTGAHDLADVITKIESVQLGTRDLQVSLSANGININYLDGLGGLLRINEVGEGSTASDLGIRTSAAISFAPVLGQDLDPMMGVTTRLSQLFGGAGLGAGSSFQITQGEKTHVISTTDLETVEDLLNAIEGSGAHVKAEVDPDGRSFSVQSLESGTSLSIGENGGTLASQLGLRTMDVDTRLSELNLGEGVYSSDGGDTLEFTRTDGTQFSVDLSDAITVGDVLDRINTHPDNAPGPLQINASLATAGNGIVLSATAGTQPIEVRSSGSSQIAYGLGLADSPIDTAVGEDNAGASVIGGRDVSGVEVEGAFTTLIRIREAIELGDSAKLDQLSLKLDEDLRRMSFARSDVGTRQQAIERMQDLSAEQQIQLKEIESEEIDADLAEVISELNARQAALQASLQLMGQTARLTLFDFL